MLFLMQIYTNPANVDTTDGGNLHTQALFLTCINLAWRFIHEEIGGLVATGIYHHFLEHNGRIVGL